jgi:dephospho-CoA kinase
MSEELSPQSMTGRVLVLCGPPGSGKGVVARKASERGMSVLSLGDIVRAETTSKGLSETPENVGKTALSMREEHGEEIVVDRLIPNLMSALEGSDVLIDGMRQPEEMDRLREHVANVTVVAMSAAPQSRLEWLEGRGRGEDGGGEEFAEREEREWGWGLEMLMEQAHAIILNEGSLEELEERSDMILETLGF